MAKPLAVDFSQESDIKEKLFSDMMSKYNELQKKESAPKREAISFEDLIPQKRQVKTLSPVDNKEKTIKPPTK